MPGTPPTVVFPAASPAALVSSARRAEGRRFGYGGDYNPEQWPEQTWVEDVALMAEAGVTFATVGVFSWARLEPRRGEWDFGWLDRVLDLLHEGGIAVDLATATASAPAWLAAEHPEVLPVDRFGARLSYGSRQSWCPSSSAYRDASLALVEQMATRYAAHPALAMWHVSNELGCHNAHCYCDVSAEAFRGWLRTRYADLDSLNAAWGTDFWSQRYSDWSEVLPPRASTAQGNPTQEIDFRRFSSAELLGQHVAERDVLHRLSPGVPVTTNFMVTSHIDGLDYWRWAPEQDVISNDHYLDGRLADPHVELSLCADWTRGLAGGDPWVLMEHSTSAVNWQPRNYPKARGQLMRNALQHLARGADSIGYFQWRASRAGAEKYHSAMFPHAGTQSRVWREVCELGDVLGRLAEVAGTRVQADAVMVLDMEAWWAVQRGSLPTSDLRYLEHAVGLYRALWDRGVTLDVRPPWADLSAYPVAFAPMLHLVTDADAARLAAYVEGGGHLLTTFFSGVVDEHDHIRLGGYPGAFRDLLGIRVEEFCPLPLDAVIGLDDGGTADFWIEDLVVVDAQVEVSYADGPLAGVPALTSRHHGAGRAWYLATRPDPESLGRMVDKVLTGAGVQADSLGPGVEIVRRTDGETAYAFVLNHTGSPVEVPWRGHDLISAAECDAERPLTVAPYAVACVRRGGD